MKFKVTNVLLSSRIQSQIMVLHYLIVLQIPLYPSLLPGDIPMLMSHNLDFSRYALAEVSLSLVGDLSFSHILPGLP